jgi:N-acyl homoserine lactone hydrolase
MKHRLATEGVPEQIAARGVDPADVKLAVMTHLHLDHVSAAAQWPHATFVVDRVERDAAMMRRPGPYVRSHLATIASWREVDYAGTGIEPFEGFTRTFDLFGDGSVRLVSSAGHSPGHQSILLRLRDRYALLCGDAAMTTREFREPLIDGAIMDQDAYVSSGEEMRTFLASHPETLAIPSHDRELWAMLETAYE